MVGNMLKMAIAVPALMWLAKPENKEKIVTLVKVLSKIGKFIFDFAQFGITQTLDGLYMMLSGETKWWEKLLGFGKALLGLSTIILGIGFLKNPIKTIKMIVSGVKILIGILKKQMLTNLIPGKAEGGILPKPAPVSKTIKQLKGFARGGWISGPQSGYPVSLDGGRSTSFIGHGTEYVSQKADGGAFIVPFDTPATRKDPGLTQKRASEAKSKGFSEGGLLDVPKLSIPTFSEGGIVPFNQSLPHFSVPQFSTGGVLNVSTPSIPKFDLPDVKPIKGFSEGGVVNNFNVPPLPSLNIPSPIQQFAQGGQYTQTYSPNISKSVSPQYNFATGGVLPTINIPKFDEGGVAPRPIKGGMGQLFQIFKDQTKLNVFGKMINKVKGAGQSVISKVTQGRNNQANKSRDAMMQQLEATAGQVAAVNEQNQNAIAQAEAMTSGGGGGGSSEPVLKGLPGLGTYNQNGVLKTTSTVLNSNNNSMRGLLK